jgi:phospholipid-transporting ATPase
LNGGSLPSIVKDEESKKILLELALKVEVVLACRVSPKQKSEIVTMVKDALPDKTTLSIGDGANDVPMIMAACVGIGIAGKEGLAAARASDFSISQFRFLKPLLFVHGRECYRKNANVVCYSFYKSMLYVIAQLWFGFMSVFSGMTLYEPFIYQMFNFNFTGVSIMWYAIFDSAFPIKYANGKEYDRTADSLKKESELLRDPKLYSLGK